MTVAQLYSRDLDPFKVAPNTYTSRRRFTRIDVTNTLILMVVLLYMLPAHLIVPNLTYAGRPALVVGFMLWCWWCLAHLNSRLVMTGPQPLRWAVGGYVVALLASYIAGLQRGLPTLESNGLDFAVLSAAEFLGVVLMVADGVPNWQRLYQLLRSLVWGATFMAFVGLLQALFSYDLNRFLVLPGLQLKGDLIGFEDRGTAGQHRVAGTAVHYIEYSTVLAMVLPIAIHLARFSNTQRKRRIYTAISLLLAGSIPMAISRTGIVALAVVFLVMLPVWNWRLRYNVLCLTFIMLLAFMVLRPGLLGTLKSFLFANAEDDPSIAGRTEDYVHVAHWFSQRPLLGRGPGTLIPVLYTVLDNQWLLQLVTFGIVGVIALAGLHITGVSLAGLALKRSQREEERHLCAALIATQVVAIVVGATFDSLSFTTFSTTFALTLGCCGAVWRFNHPTRSVRTSAARRH